MTVRHLHRVVDLHRPEPLRVEFHSYGCDCDVCAPYLDELPEDQRTLTFRQIGNRVWLGLAIGTAIALAIDWRGAAHALLAIVGR